MKLLNSIRMLVTNFKDLAFQRPASWRDTAALILGLVIITAQPFYLHGAANIFEAGLYLPGIDALLKGQMPYRDFIHLRGPLELYIPALGMKILGENYAVLPTYFYIGTLVTMGFCLLIARKIYQTRVFLYLMAFVFIARTFPRVSFTIGGGIRLAWGLITIYCVIHYFKNRRRVWLLLAGISSAIGIMTSIEIGVYAFLSVLTILCVESFIKRRNWLPLSSIVVYGAGSMIVFLPLCFFLESRQAFHPMLETYREVCLNLVKTFPPVGPAPRSILDVFAVMLNPADANFKYIAPLYCYVFIFAYLLYSCRKSQLRPEVLLLAIYGFLLFIGSMRSLGGPGFDIALQPEKILLFFLLERIWSILKDNREKYRQVIAGVLLAGIFFSTMVYSAIRYQKRFCFMEIISAAKSGMGAIESACTLSDSEQGLVHLDLPRMGGMVVPVTQAKDIQQLYQFIHSHTKPEQSVLFFPDLGAYHFIVDRPFVGRFPVYTLSWIGTRWHEEFMRAFDAVKPPYVVMYKQLPEYFAATQLIVPQNNAKYGQVLGYIYQNYQVVSDTPSLNIWGRKQ